MYIYSQFGVIFKAAVVERANIDIFKVFPIKPNFSYFSELSSR